MRYSKFGGRKQALRDFKAIKPTAVEKFVSLLLHGVDKMTHICQVDPSILINWTSQLLILGVSVVLFQFYSISNSC